MAGSEQILEDQPTPEEIALAKKSEYFRNYARERRKNNPDVRAKDAAYSKVYMRAYSKTPEFKAKHGEKKRQYERDKRATEKGVSLDIENYCTLRLFFVPLSYVKLDHFDRQL